MTREEFIKHSLAMGIGLPFLTSLLASCEKEAIDFPEFTTNFTGKVLVVGAGSAGLAAGYLLSRYGVDFQIIEASSIYGGRVKRAANFVDFPIDTGAEWIHTSPAVLAEILNDPQSDASIDFITYNPQTFAAGADGNLSPQNFATNFYSEYKFKNTTWYGFFEQYIVPHIQSNIVYNQPITEVDYSSDKVRLTADDGTIYEADRVVITAPIKVLQGDTIGFVPALPSATSEAINSIRVGDGLKVFIEFKEQFYPDLFFNGSLISSLSADEKIFYDAAFRKDSNRHVLGLFTINEPASEYTNLNSEQEIIDKIIAELDELFDGKASENYLQHVIQNWSKEPYIQGAYSFEFANDRTETMNTLNEGVGNKVFFAGEAQSDENQSTVHGACESAYNTVERILT